jgi:nucleoid-associated protein YgaU
MYFSDSPTPAQQKLISFYKNVAKPVALSAFLGGFVLAVCVAVLLLWLAWPFVNRQAGQVGSGTSTEQPSQVNPSEDTTYTVKPGDTLWKIAADQLGDGNAYYLLKEYNGLGSEELAVGQVLKIPALENRPEQVKTVYGIDESKDATEQVAPVETNEVHTITVQPGDSLWKISQAQLGSGYSWTSLYAANQGVVGANPDLIYPGQVLVIPSK